MKNNEFDNILINTKSDRVLCVLMILSAALLYIFMSLHRFIDLVYLISLIWYFIGIFLIVKARIFSGLGIYLAFLYCYVQCGVLMQGYYREFDIRLTYCVMTYNILAPFILLSCRRSANIRNTNLLQNRFKNEWIISIFLVGVGAMIVFFTSVGSVPLLAPDAENFRVQALAGRGFLVVIASMCFQVSVSLSRSKMQMIIMLIVGCVLLIGTGYRSSALSLALIAFMAFWVGTGKKFLFPAIILLVVLCLVYALVGVMRSGNNWSWNQLYTVVLWRFYVNTSNFDTIISRFPLEQLQYGKSLINDLLVILPGAQQTFMMQLKEIMGVYFDGGSLTPSVFGEGYYNWGWLGAYTWPLITLYIVSYLDKFNKKFFHGGFYYVTVYAMTGFTTSCMIPTLTNIYIPALLVCIVLKWIDKHFSLKI